ncbi:MAG TPA: DNA repair protein RecN, partial [Candidatus Hydrogenedentes bacterium]|nr:DNA repair protein RecN [Candidatus Hydrogenedentota bacterium]
MLETLRIKNYALIDDIEIDFRDGFHVLTGETGAGKSIIVGALNLVLGMRASSDVVREGTPRTEVDAAFRIPQGSARLRVLLEEHDVDMAEDLLILSRVVGKDGRSKARVCGALTPVSLLAAIGDELVDLHGQHEHQSLLKTERQLDVLDGFAGAEAQALEVGGLVADLRELDRRIKALE